MASVNKGFRYIIAVENLTDAVVTDYDEGTLVWDITGQALYCQKGGAWKAVTVAA